MADNRKYIAIKPTTLSTGVNVGDTTCIPSQIKDRLGNSITAMTSFGTKGFGVISPETDKEEQFVFTGLSGGTISGISAVTMQDPYTETSGWLKEHAAGEPIILYTNSPAFYNEFANTQNDNTFAGTQTFSVSPVVPTGGTGTQAANHDDIAAAVTGASGTATESVFGTVKLSVAAASAPNPIAVGDNDPRVPTSGEKALLAAITASAAELNILDGYTGTTADLNETSVIVQATDITGAELETLSSSATSDASALHYHKVSSPVTVSSTGQGTDYGAYSFDLATRAVAGWSDTNGVLGFMLGTTTTFQEYYNFKDAAAFGFQPMMRYVSNSSFTVASSATANGYVYITTDRWACTNSTIYKNGSSATISGTARYGVLGHDPTNSYLLVLYSSTAIAKFSGISGTTITNVNSDVTLDTAVAQNRSFIYDNTNSRYICIDNTNKVVRRFNSTGTTIDTVSISGILDNVEATSKILGLCTYQGRVMVAVMSLLVPGANTAGTDMLQMITTFYPTSMTI